MSLPLIVGIYAMLTSEGVAASLEAGAEIATAASLAIAAGVCMGLSIGLGMDQLKKYI